MGGFSRFSMAEEELLGRRFKLEGLLGEGTYGSVVKVSNQFNEVTAIKIIPKTGMKDKEWAKVEDEFKAMFLLDSHPSILKLKNSFESHYFAYFVLEYCSRGDLLNLVSKRQGVPEEEAKVLFRQVVEGVKFAHDEGWVHRDLKLENILIAGDGSIRIADWGFATRYSKGKKMSDSCGSVHYASPEICLGAPYRGPEVDVWCLGVTLYALVSASMPFFGDNNQEIMLRAVNADYRMPDNWSLDLRSLVSGMLCVETNRRFSIDDVLNHPWLMIPKKPEAQLEVPPKAQTSSSGNTVVKSQPIDRDAVIASMFHKPQLPETTVAGNAPRVAGGKDDHHVHQTSRPHRPQAIDPRRRRKSIVELAVEVMEDKAAKQAELESSEEANSRANATGTSPPKRALNWGGLSTKVRNFVRSLLQRPNMDDDHPSTGGALRNHHPEASEATVTDLEAFETRRPRELLVVEDPEGQKRSGSF